ncbi:MAG: glycosyltransferase family 2 protein [Caldilineaceae bacterium]|nr:glycosyltransferase family 2 protein [Caldilineaceae bacterium]
MDKLLISVLMPVYNSERYVADAIRSILAQSFGHFEFIIVDDGSTDDSARIIAEFAAQDTRIRPFFAEHSGRARSANTAIALAHRREFYAGATAQQCNATAQKPPVA